MVKFIDEWKKIKELHDTKTIDDELYELWVEKTLKKYNYPIKSFDGFMHIPDELIIEE